MDLSMLKHKDDNGVTNRALSNVFKEATRSGFIVGLIHRIDPVNEHTTKIFYCNGEVLEVNGGLTCGYNGEGPRGLHMVILTIPYAGKFYDMEDVASMGKEFMEKDKGDKEHGYFIIRSPKTAPGGEYISACEGYKALEKEIINVNKHPDTILFEK